MSALTELDNIEVIVVDGASTDNTPEIVRQYPVKLINSTRQRASQLNEGARQAKGDIFLFLYADCVLQEGALNEIVRCVRKGFVGGCLSHRISSDRAIYRAIEGSGNIRARMSGVFYGDQAIFVRKDAFFNVGGFDDVPLFDDVIFSKKIKKEGKTRVLNKNVYTSPRRWESQGIVKTTILNWLASLGYYLGFSPASLKRIYKDVR